MEIKFNKKGNLQNDLNLLPFEFKSLFGYNKEREKKISSLFSVAKIFGSFGCKEMYIVGSFITERKN